MSTEIVHEARVPVELAGKRVDQIVAEMFQQYSRGRIQTWIKDGSLRINGEQRKPKDKLWGDELVSIVAQMQAEGDWLPEPIDIDVVYEDGDILIINKPAGLVVHPGAGNPNGTLVNALLHADPALINLPRAGIVHRLDKDTTGLMVVARTLEAHTSLVKQLQKKTAKRQYQAVVIGAMTGGGKVDEPIGRHRAVRTRMAVVASGKPAVTHYRVSQRFHDYTHIDVSLETGRTHQIRVHMASIQYPLVGDPLYSGRMRLPAGASSELISTLQGFKRQALHAYKLGLTHPRTAQEMEWSAELPADFVSLLEVLKASECNR